MEPDKIRNFILLLIAAPLALKFLSVAIFPDTGKRGGEGYTVEKPAGWREIKKKKKGFSISAADEYEPQTLTFVTTKINPKTRDPQATIAFTEMKLKDATWIEDEFPIIVRRMSGRYRIEQKGEIKVDQRISKWVLLRDDKREELKLQFYMIDDRNVMFRIEYTAGFDYFNVYRKAFEDTKETFRFKGMSIAR